MTERSRATMWVAAGVAVLAIGGAVAFVWIRIADSRDKPAGPRQDTPGGVGGYLEEAKRDRAQLSAMTISKAIEMHRIRTDGTPPTNLKDLIQPSDGPPLLQGGADALLDPWGQPFLMRVEGRPDGTDYVVVYTTAPDGTMISQFGVGERAMPKW